MSYRRAICGIKVGKERGATETPREIRISELVSEALDPAAASSIFLTIATDVASIGLFLAQPRCPFCERRIDG